MFEEALYQVSTHGRTGLSQWVSEMAATFGLVARILGALLATGAFAWLLHPAGIRAGNDGANAVETGLAE